MRDGADQRTLVGEVWADVPAQGPPEVRSDVASTAGPVCIVYHSHRATGSDVEGTERPQQPLLDQAGRPIVLTYGFVCQGVVVGPVDETDLRVARTAALATYRRFYADEARQTLETSAPFPLRSSTSVPAPARRPAPRTSDGPPEPAGRTLLARFAPPTAPQDFAGVRRRVLLARRALIGLLVLATVSGVALVLLTRPRPVGVPSVIGLTEPEAQQRLRDAGLDPTVGPPQTDRKCQPGRVTGQVPSGGSTLGKKGGSVGITVCVFQTAVPDVVQLDYASASRRITGRKLTPERHEEASVAPPNTVIRTEPRAGAQVPEGSDVQIFVSSGPRTPGRPKL
jgi:hypothetical protein